MTREGNSLATAVAYAAEVVIETRSGKRHVVQMVRNTEDTRASGGD